MTTTTTLATSARLWWCVAAVVALAALSVRGEDESRNVVCARCYEPDGTKKPGTNWATRKCTSSGDPHVRSFTMTSGEIGGAPHFFGVLWLVTWWEQEGSTCVQHFVKIKTKHWGRDDEGAPIALNATADADEWLQRVDDDGTLHIRGQLPDARDVESVERVEHVEGDERVEGDEATVGDVGLATLPLSQGGGCFSSGCRHYPSGARVCFHRHGGAGGHTSVHIDLPECLRTAGAQGTCAVSAVRGTGWGCPHHTTRTSSVTPNPTPNPTPEPTPDPTPLPPEDDFCLQDARHAAVDLCRQAFFTRFGPDCPGLPDAIIECVEDVCLLGKDELDMVLDTVEAAMDDFTDELKDDDISCAPMTSAPATTPPPNTEPTVFMRRDDEAN